MTVCNGRGECGDESLGADRMMELKAGWVMGQTARLVEGEEG